MGSCAVRPCLAHNIGIWEIVGWGGRDAEGVVLIIGEKDLGWGV